MAAVIEHRHHLTESEIAQLKVRQSMMDSDVFEFKRRVHEEFDRQQLMLHCTMGVAGIAAVLSLFALMQMILK